LCVSGIDLPLSKILMFEIVPTECIFYLILTVWYFFGPYNILWVTSWAINCHMTLSAMNYLLIIVQDETYFYIYCTRLAAASDKVYQLFAYGRRFSPGTPSSSTTKTGCHDIAEILLRYFCQSYGDIDGKNTIYCSSR
jgi:hypothetical protein